MRYIIRGIYKGNKIERIAFGDFQAFTIINQLTRDGVTELEMCEDVKE